MNTLTEKARVIKEVTPIVELLEDIKNQLDELPRTAVATRQLSVIICKLQLWQETYEPRTASDTKEEIGQVPQREELDRALKAYRRNGYFGLTDREKFCIEFFDKHYSKAAA